jgi:VIT1/CCC1 family predicted Fe2+/Mn2+ transporter
MDVNAEHRHHPGEQHAGGTGQKLNWLRAGVLGSNDGIVSTAGVVIGVAGATPHNLTAIATAGLAALVAGAFSMAGGEYVSVSTQRDTEKALIAKEKWELENLPVEEHEELADLYHQAWALRTPGSSGWQMNSWPRTLWRLMRRWSWALIPTTTRTRGLPPAHPSCPSLVGALIPLVVILLPFGSYRIWITAAAVIVGLFLTGWISASLGGAARGRAVIRNVLMGSATMVATYLIGMVFGTAVR